MDEAILEAPQRKLKRTKYWWEMKETQASFALAVLPTHQKQE
jgi:hypothetical protein